MEKGTANPIAAGFNQAEAIIKKHARTFYFASHFLPKEKKLAAYSIYAICWLSDESVDNPAANNLAEVKRNIAAAYDKAELAPPLLCAFRETVNKYGIPRAYFDDLADGMEMDLKQNRYKDFTELNSYCYRAAGVIGLIMLKVLNGNTKDTQKPAIDLGIAMQLTNICRDIKEDFQMGRVYLPMDEMQRYGVSEGDLASCRLNDNFKKLMQYQISRARQYYAASESGIRALPDMASRFTVLVMKEMYSGILDAIKNNGYDVFSKRACINMAKKIFIIFKVLLQGRFL